MKCNKVKVICPHKKERLDMETEVTTLVEQALIRSEIYKLLATVFLYPSEEVFQSFRSDAFIETLERHGATLPDETEWVKEVTAFCEILKEAFRQYSQTDFEGEYNRLFAHIGSAKCPPYETEYGYDNVFQKTDAMADIAGFYTAYGLEVADDYRERADFISVELEFMQLLTLKEAYALENDRKEQYEICRDTQKKFLQDHLGRWLTMFTKVLANSTENTFYAQCGRLTEKFLESEFAYLGIVPTKVTAPVKEPSDKPGGFSCQECPEVTSCNV
jgi:DMSO reductase family type II enzyme chaperone